MQYPWNFIFQGCFWKKKSIIEHHTSSLKVTINDNISKKKVGFSWKDDALEPSVEAISLDMRQQELDARYNQICTKILIHSCMYIQIDSFLYILIFCFSFVCNSCVCSCTTHFGASPQTFHL